MHLSPLLYQSWSSSLDSKNPDEKSLEKLSELLRDEAKLQMPRYQRRMNLMQNKRGFEKRSDYLEKLSELFSVADYEYLSGDEFQIHLFIESADSQMAKMATELLETDK